MELPSAAAATATTPAPGESSPRRRVMLSVPLRQMLKLAADDGRSAVVTSPAGAPTRRSPDVAQYWCQHMSCRALRAGNMTCIITRTC